MNFEWDESKSEVCFIDRGFDFLYATQAFLDPNRILHEDTRYSYGEDRFQLLGMIEQRLYLVVFTQRHEVTRIISARKANQREVRQYEECTRNG